MSAFDATRDRPVRLALIAVALLALLVAITAGPALGPIQAGVDALVAVAGYDYVIAAVLGALAVLAGGAVFLSGRGAVMHQTEMPTVERPTPVPSAGEGFEATIGGWRFATRIFGGDTAEAVRERLRAAAVATLSAETGCSPPEARERVDAGTWTDDEAAAAFLAGEYTPLGTWLRALARGETGPEYRARRTVAAIVALRSAADEPGGERTVSDDDRGAKRTGDDDPRGQAAVSNG